MQGFLTNNGSILIGYHGCEIPGGLRIETKLMLGAERSL
jgi:hypothetical protein